MTLAILICKINVSAEEINEAVNCVGRNSNDYRIVSIKRPWAVTFHEGWAFIRDQFIVYGFFYIIMAVWRLL